MTARKLTALEKKFVALAPAMHNDAEAYRLAGGSPKGAKQQAHRLRKRLATQLEAREAEIAAQREAAAAAEVRAAAAIVERAAVTKEYITDALQEIVERCLQRAPVMVRQGREFVQAVDDEGRHVWQFDAKGANGALRMLGESIGMYKQVIDEKRRSKMHVTVVYSDEGRRT